MNKRSRSTASPNPDADKIEQERKMDEEYRTEQLTAAKRRLPTQYKQTTPIIHALVSDMSQSASSSSSFPTTTPSHQQQRLLQTPPPHRPTRKSEITPPAYSPSSPSIGAAAAATTRSRTSAKGGAKQDANRHTAEGERGGGELDTRQQALERMIEDLKQAPMAAFDHEDNDNKTVAVRGQCLRAAKKFQRSRDLNRSIK